MRPLLCCIFSFFCLPFAISQQAIEKNEESQIRRLLDLRKELNFKEDREIKAWGIQLMVSRDKYELLEKQSRFNRKEEKQANWTYQQPYYRLNWGAYYTKLEAYMQLQKVKEDFPGAFVYKNNQAQASEF
ncbi:sporulation protein [Saprospira sp. CCB-QB6]|uniref:sporulation protein n=1 Tax=Saprospira sp. CCB-QB6 TaxID=3023936 RepID=UPI00234A6021|nr:sporulation protein [Saprospira sp. CCB-QB6]WCL82755.1 sporulation protein [Saprospira sp. CCB-QB6]